MPSKRPTPGSASEDPALLVLQNALDAANQRGDAALRDHISQQVAQINTALHSSELLEMERIGAVLQELRSHVALVAELRNADRDATQLAFQSATKLGEAHNDLLHKMEKLSVTFATIAYVRDMLDVLEKMITKQRAEDERNADRRFGRLENWQSRITGGVIVFGAVGVMNLVQTLVQGFR